MNPQQYAGEKGTDHRIHIPEVGDGTFRKPATLFKELVLFFRICGLAFQENQAMCVLAMVLIALRNTMTTATFIRRVSN